MTNVYRVAEFARLAGVTVRALQYYDRIGLLKPTETTESGHRLYARCDLLRLQQIVTLKWMGFKLEQIGELLAQPQFDVRAALVAQQSAINAQIERLQAASVALGRALDAPDLEAELLDQNRIATVLAAVSAPPESEWVRQFYSETAWAGIAARSMTYTAEDFARFTENWQRLIADFATVRDQPITSAAVQRLAAVMWSYVSQFTAGDPETAAGLQRLWQTPDAVHNQYRLADRELELFMAAALEHYRGERSHSAKE